MTNAEVAIRIEEMLDTQLDCSLYDALAKLEDDLLGDPTGKARKALRYNRMADYWRDSARVESKEQEAYFRGLANEQTR